MKKAEGSEISNGTRIIGLAMGVGALVVVVGTLVHAVREDAKETVPEKVPVRLSGKNDGAGSMAPHVSPDQSWGQEKQRASQGPYGDPDFRDNIPVTIIKQTKTLREEAVSSPGHGKRSLALSEERIEALEKSGNLIH